MIYQIGLMLVLMASVGFNSTNATEILDYVENNIIKNLDNISTSIGCEYYGNGNLRLDC